MDIQFNCPQCHIPICVPGHSAGKSGKCPNCGATVVVPLIQTNEKQDWPSISKTTPSPNGLNSASNPKCSLRQADSGASSAYSARRPNAPLNRPKSIEKKSDLFAYTETTKRGFWANAEDTWLPGALKISALLVLVGIFYTCGSYYQGVYGPRKNKQQELAKKQEQEKQVAATSVASVEKKSTIPAEDRSALIRTLAEKGGEVLAQRIKASFKTDSAAHRAVSEDYGSPLQISVLDFEEKKSEAGENRISINVKYKLLWMFNDKGKTMMSLQQRNNDLLISDGGIKSDLDASLYVDPVVLRTRINLSSGFEAKYQFTFEKTLGEWTLISWSSL